MKSAMYVAPHGISCPLLDGTTDAPMYLDMCSLTTIIVSLCSLSAVPGNIKPIENVGSVALSLAGR